MDLKSSKALSMLLNYDSDNSDKDSGYTSEEEKKRKHNFLDSREKRTKKMKISCEEDMLVDGENFNWYAHTSKDDLNSHRHTQSTLHNISRDLNRRENLISSHYNHTISQPNRLIPLPKELDAPSSHIDDPAMHDGRVRSFPHERGNWASIIYIPLTFGVFCPLLNSLVAVLITTCKDNNVEIFQCSDYHISLSQTFILRLEWIQPLVEDMKRRLLKFKRFSLWVHGLTVFTNKENTRTFLALRVDHGKNEVKEVADIANESLKKYKLSSLYEDCSFHVSIAWCHGNRSEELKKLLSMLQNACDHYFNTENEMRTFEVTEVHVKTGNRIQNLPLNQT